MEKGLKVSVSSGIDWLSCTFSRCCFEQLRDNLLFFGLVESNKFQLVNPLHGYQNAIKLFGGRLQWGFKFEESYAHFELSGQGCNLLGGRVWELLIFLKTLNVKFTRLDLAFDFMNTENVMLNIRKDLYSTNFKGFQTWQEISTNNGRVKATTFYLGSRSSPCFARVYDKGLESGLSEEEGKIIRFEFIFRAEQSQVVAKLLLTACPNVSDVAGLTFNMYRFGVTVRKHRKNIFQKSRWYQDLLDLFLNLKLRDLPSYPRNIDFERFCKWIVEQVSPQISAIASENDLTPGQVMDTILFYFKNDDVQKHNKNVSYCQAFKKLKREEKELQESKLWMTT